MDVKAILQEAADVAFTGDRSKNFLLAAISLRNDGAKVTARNITVREPQHEGHAEYRALRKSDSNCILFVARVLKSENIWGNAKPCKKCQALIVNRKVKRVYYTISPGVFGVWNQGDNWES